MVAYKVVIDGDGHVTEPPHLLEYVEESYRHLAPRVVKDEDGYERFAFEGKLMSLAHRPPISLRKKIGVRSLFCYEIGLDSVHG